VAFARPGANGYDLYLDGAEWISAPGDQTRYVWAPDSHRIAFENDGDPRVIYVAEVGVTQPVAVTADTTKSWNPSWAPDSQQLAFASTVDGNAGIYGASVASGLVRLTPLDVWSQAPAWSPGGGAIAYVGGEPDKTWSLYLMQANGGGRVRLHGPVYPEAPAAWSSTGDRLALLVDDGDRELAVIRGDGGDFRLLTNNSANDWDPAWEPR
jgi:Tol biopolymer transport system component